TPATGGLLREPGLMERRRRFAVEGRWTGLASALGVERRAGERVVSLFCYPPAPLERFVEALRAEPTLLLVTAPVAARLGSAWLGRRPVGALFRAWNGLAPWPVALPPAQPWADHVAAWRDRLAAQPDLTSRLLAFAEEKR